MKRQEHSMSLVLQILELEQTQFYLFDGKRFPSFEELKTFCQLTGKPDAVKSEYQATLRRYPALAGVLSDSVQEYHREYGLQENEAAVESINDLYEKAALYFWSKNKQVFRFDSEFLSELANTKELRFIPNLFDRLPFSYFYLDFSENEALCQEIGGTGTLINVFKGIHDGEEHYFIDSVKFDSNNQLMYRDTLWYPNKDYTEEVSSQKAEAVFFNGATQNTDTMVTDRGVYRNILAQCLLYLASDEKDIRENETTARTYRKPAPNQPPKNKFSEIRMQDVGVRFGTAVRAWKKKQNGTSAQTGLGTGTKRPHFRRAHWHTYWCGQGHSERKLVWLHELAINMDEGKDAGMVIHRAQKTIQQEYE